MAVEVSPGNVILFPSFQVFSQPWVGDGDYWELCHQTSSMNHFSLGVHKSVLVPGAVAYGVHKSETVKALKNNRK